MGVTDNVAMSVAECMTSLNGMLRKLYIIDFNYTQ